MTWNAAVFGLLLQARDESAKRPGDDATLNPIVHQFVDSCFFQSHMLSLRRLVDGYPIESEDKRKDVYSLTSLLEDLKKYAPLKTRCSLFAVEGRAYDIESIKKKQDDFWAEKDSEGPVCIPQDLDWKQIQERHEEIDALAGVSAGLRSPTDKVRECVLEFLNTWVKTSSPT